MILKAVSYGRLARKKFVEKYPSPDQIPASQRRDYEYLAAYNRMWFANAEALGWREPAKADEEKYLQGINRARLQKNAN